MKLCTAAHCGPNKMQYMQYIIHSPNNCKFFIGYTHSCTSHQLAPCKESRVAVWVKNPWCFYGIIEGFSHVFLTFKQLYRTSASTIFQSSKLHYAILLLQSILVRPTNNTYHSSCSFNSFKDILLLNCIFILIRSLTLI